MPWSGVLSVMWTAVVSLLRYKSVTDVSSCQALSFLLSRKSTHIDDPAFWVAGAHLIFTFPPPVHTLLYPRGDEVSLDLSPCVRGADNIGDGA
jgi:hypothetical protein